MCECELLTDWVASLPLSFEGGRFDEIEITVEEGTDGFFGSASQTGLENDVLEPRRTELSNAGVNHEIDENPDSSTIYAYPGNDRFGGSWSLRIRLVGMKSSWGLESRSMGLLGVWREQKTFTLYLGDSDAALTAQEERQQRATEILQPLTDALEGIVEAG